ATAIGPQAPGGQDLSVRGKCEGENAAAMVIQVHQFLVPRGVPENDLALSPHASQCLAVRREAESEYSISEYSISVFPEAASFPPAGTVPDTNRAILCGRS